MKSFKMWLARTFLMVLGLGLATGLGSILSPNVSAYNDYAATFFPGDVKINGDLKLLGDEILDSGGTVRLSIGAANVLTGSFAPSGAITNATYETVYTRTSAQVKVTTPTAVGQEVFDTTLKQAVYSSGTTTCFDWVTSTGGRPSGY